MPIKITYFCAQLFPLAMNRSTGFGGAETELWNVARALARIPDLSVSAVTITDEICAPTQRDGVSLVPVSGATGLTAATPWLKRRRRVLAYYLDLLKTLRQEKADFYFVKLASIEACITWLASRLQRVPLGFRVEHDWETNLPDMVQNIFHGNKLGARLFVQCLKRADLVIVQTTKQQLALRENFGIESRIIPNGHYLPAHDQVEHNPAKRTDVLWVGRAHPMKRPHLFLELAKRNPGIAYTMIMAPSAEYPDILERCHAEIAGMSNVKFVPGAPPEALPAFYQQARCLVLTSEAEGFSNVIIEAMKYGTPVISLDHNPNNSLLDVTPHYRSGDGFSSVTIPTAHGYYTGDSLDITDHVITTLFHWGDGWTDFHRAAYRYAIENFDLNRVAKQYHSLFHSLKPGR